jgi:hypothetical protein
LAVDSGGTVPAGTYGPLTASTDAASRAIAWSLILEPVSDNEDAEPVGGRWLA